jgi:hypothetical protein|tara:strand:+ start:106 stop:348 length:243 start_codon:yes stop_codon:yes gene_type:complete
MKLPVIRKLSEFSLTEINNSIKLLESITDSRGITENELDALGEILSNLYGAQNVRESVMRGLKRTDALNNFMKRVTSVGK